jgi:hypothetical protein
MSALLQRLHIRTIAVPGVVPLLQVIKELDGQVLTPGARAGGGTASWRLSRPSARRRGRQELIPGHNPPETAQANIRGDDCAARLSHSRSVSQPPQDSNVIVLTARVSDSRSGPSNARCVPVRHPACLSALVLRPGLGSPARAYASQEQGLRAWPGRICRSPQGGASRCAGLSSAPRARSAPSTACADSSPGGQLTTAARRCCGDLPVRRLGCA